MGRRFSIRYKFLIVTTMLLVFCVGAYLLMASRVFKLDKVELVFDYNRSNVNNIAAEVDSILQSATDKMKLFAVLRQDQQSTRKSLKSLLQANSSIVFLALSSDFKKLNRVSFKDKRFLETYGVDDNFFGMLSTKHRPVPYEKLKRQGEAVWSASIKDGPPLIGLGQNVVVEDEEGRPFRQFAVVAYIKADPFLKALKRGQLAKVYITNSEGQLLAFPDEKTSRVEELLPLISKAKKSKIKTQVVDYKNSESKRILGAFSKAFKGQIFILSKVHGEAAFAAVNRLVYRSVVFAGIVVTLSFIAAILFSRNLTRPIEVLMQGMRKVGEGDYQTKIDVQSRDEIRVLADSFNQMIQEVRDSRDQLEEINRDLEEKVKERTNELEKQNLAVKQAQEALLRTTRLAAVGEIAGQAAHEVLNPLTSILSRVQKMQDRLKNNVIEEAKVLQEIRQGWQEDYQSGGFEGLIKSWQKPSEVKPNWTLWDEDVENLKEVESRFFSEMNDLQSDAHFLIREGQRINRIVNSMRSMSVVKSDIRIHSVDKLIQQSVDIMADLALKSGIKIDFKNEYEGATVKVDEDEFIQCLTNLIRNSLQAIEAKELDSGGLVVLRLYKSEGSICLEVEDNGCGVEEENKNRLFESHFTTKDKEEGTGIGLKISRRFIRAFNGDIELKESKLNQGSVFLITLPAVEEQDELKVS